MKKDNIEENEMSNEEGKLVQNSNENLTEEMNLNENKEEIINNENNKATDSNNIDSKSDKKNNTCMKELFANLLDQAIIMACSGIILLLFDFIIKGIGYMVVMPEQVLLIIYFIVNCIYSPITKRTKLKNTIARKILHLN